MRENDAPDGEEKKDRSEDDEDHCLQPHYPNPSSSSVLLRSILYNVSLLFEFFANAGLHQTTSFSWVFYWTFRPINLFGS